MLICLFVLLQVHVTSIRLRRFKFVGAIVCLFLFVLVQVHVSSVRPRSFKFVDIFACLTPRRFLIAKHCTLPASSNFILASCLSLILRNAYCLLLSVSFVSFPEIKPKHYLGLRMFGLTGINVGRCYWKVLCLDPISVISVILTLTPLEKYVCVQRLQEVDQKESNFEIHSLKEPV